MHSTAEFLSMPNQHGLVMGGNAERGFNDNSARGYPTRLALTTRQVTDVVMYDEDILAVKGGRQIAAPEQHSVCARICDPCSFDSGNARAC